MNDSWLISSRRFFVLYGFLSSWLDNIHIWTKASRNVGVSRGDGGDLAFKRIFPALQNMVQIGALDMPIIGVIRGGRQKEGLLDQAHSSPETHGNKAESNGLALPIYRKKK